MVEGSSTTNRDIIVTRRYPNCDAQNKRIELQYDGPNSDLRVSKQKSKPVALISIPPVVIHARVIPRHHGGRLV